MQLLVAGVNELSAVTGHIQWPTRGDNHWLNSHGVAKKAEMRSAEGWAFENSISKVAI